MKRPLALMCSILLFTGFSAQAGPVGSISIDNWANHQQVKDVRAIYDEITRGIKDKKYKTRVRRFNIDSRLCSSYPIKSEALTMDDQNRPRLYQVEQIGSHRESFTVERYYDVKGMLRFVYVDRFVSSVRIYLNGEGKVFWAVEKNGDKFTALDSNNDDWETKPNNAAASRKAFEGQQACPEIKK